MVHLDKGVNMEKLDIDRVNIFLNELIENYGGIVGCEFEGEEYLFEFFERGNYPMDLNEEIAGALNIDSYILDINENTQIKDIWKAFIY